VTDWTEKPAQFLAPGLTRGGLTLEEWHQKVIMVHDDRNRKAKVGTTSVSTTAIGISTDSVSTH
jgi:hypothetical protein